MFSQDRGSRSWRRSSSITIGISESICATAGVSDQVFARAMPQFVDACLQLSRMTSLLIWIVRGAGYINLFKRGGRGAMMYRLEDDNIQTNPSTSKLTQQIIKLSLIAG